MIGFLERDLCLTLPALRIYGVILLLFAVLACASSSIAVMFGFYLILFSANILMTLFSYDDFNHWQGYAATLPNGRAAPVNARYLLCAFFSVAIFALELLVGLFTRAATPWLSIVRRDYFVLDDALLYLGAFLLYTAVMLPIFYRFGGAKGRIVTTATAVFFAIAVVLATTLLSSVANEAIPAPARTPLPLLLPLAGAAALALSWRVSLSIMAKKEL